MKYPIRVEPTEDGWEAWCPDFGRLTASTCEATPQEAIDALFLMIEDLIEYLQLKKLKVPKPFSRTAEEAIWEVLRTKYGKPEETIDDMIRRVSAIIQKQEEKRMIPIPLNTLEKCKNVLKEHLTPEERAILTKIRIRVVESLTKPMGEVLLITSKNPLISQAAASFIFHVCLIERKIGQKIIYVTGVGILEKNLLIDDADIVIVDKVELIDKFKMKGFLEKLQPFTKRGGVCIIPLPLTYEEMITEFSKTVADNFFKSLFIELRIGGV